ATNASGSCGLKYGRTLDWLRGLRIVDGTGRALVARNPRIGKTCAGYAALYRPTHIFAGSEGTLGVISRIELALAPPPPDFFLAMAFFEQMGKALDFVIEARGDPRLSPRSMEFLDGPCLEILRPKAEGVNLPREADVMVYFEQEYRTEKEKETYLEAWFALIERHTRLSQDTQVAASPAQRRHLLALRHHVPEKMNEESTRAVRGGGCKISTDWAVPYDRLRELFAFFDTLRDRLEGMLICRFGHIGEGHPHFNFIAKDSDERRRAEEVDYLMAKKSVALGGTVAGEHGIGKLKREHLRLQCDEFAIRSMKALKRVFDPKGILAPGNIFS
ncbi:MAG: FAD-binding oxidoreductase, partial [Deltaproteobacteria bacterium]|nr:FAD-binding oxidoreductase [Deltaproteobacteria bacterium]